jgi:uncharacterized membrane protein YcaP (DUF421 family)
MSELFFIDWREFFIPTHSIVEMIVRGTFMYVALFLIFRFGMKRQAGSIGIADLLVIVVIADAAQNAFTHDYKSVTEGLFLVVTIVFWDFFIDWLGFRFPAMRRFLEPPPVLLVDRGKINHRNLRHEFITMDELDQHLRKAGVEDVSEVETAVMESSGEITVVPRDAAKKGGAQKKRHGR